MTASAPRSPLDIVAEAIYRGERQRAEAVLSQLPGSSPSATDEATLAALRAAIVYLSHGDAVAAHSIVRPALDRTVRPKDSGEEAALRREAQVNLWACWLFGSEDARVRRGAEALSRGHRAHAALEGLGDRTGRIVCCVGLALAYVSEGEIELGAEMYRQAVELGGRGGGRGSVWISMAESGLEALRGRPLAAVAALRHAVELAERMEMPFLRCALLVSLAERLETAGERVEIAITAARRAFDASRSIGAPAFYMTCRASRTLGEMLLRAGRWDEARDVLADAARQAEATSNPGACNLYEMLGHLALRRGDLDDARSLAARAGQSISGDRLAARIASASTDAASALALYTRVRDAAGPQSPEVVIEAELGRASTAIVAGDLDMARRAIDAAGALLEPVFRPRLQTEFDHVRGKLLAALGRHEEAVVSLERARVAHEASGNRYEAACFELDIAAHAATTGCGADVERIGASADVLASFGSPLGPRLRSLARTLAARPGAGTTAPTVPLPLELLSTPSASAEQVLRTIFQLVCERIRAAAVVLSELESAGSRRLIDRRGDAAVDELDDYEIRDRLGRRFMLSIEREPSRESPWLGTLLAAAELALEAAALRAGSGDLGRTSRLVLAPELGFHAAAFGERLAMLARLTWSRCPVLLTGEPGIGKRSFARALHQLRGGGPLVEVDCEALAQDEQLDAQLFGHRKANAGRGLVREADGGTLLMLGIERLSPAAQDKIGRLLSSREVRPVGSRASVSVSVRLFATCREDLAVRVDEGLLDPELHDRLTVLPIRLQPLRHRPELIVALTRHFLGTLEPEPEALASLLCRPWPGNIRELKNELQAASRRAREAGRSSVLLEDL